LSGAHFTFIFLSMKSMKPVLTVLATTLALVCAGANAQSTAPAMPATPTKAASPAAAAMGAPTALKIIDRKVGDGALAESGSPVAVHYTGYLYDATAPDNKGKKFDSSIDRKLPFGFIVGAGRVIKGWDEGVPGMKVGGQRTLIIPPNKGYGEGGAGASIPPNATLLFDVELMSVIGKTTNAGVEPSAYVPAPK
jgi:FKBP-type peptidyl-prolyl cis-trans isomerase FkpA